MVPSGARQRLREAVAWLVIQPTPLAVAQLGKLKRQLPLLYAILSLNALAVTYTHRGIAPDWLTYGMAGPLCAIGLLRAAVWMVLRVDNLTPEEAVGHLRRITVLASLLSVGYIAWALALSPYGGPYEKGHVAFFVAITVIGCIFCLMHLPQAAFSVIATVTIPSFWHFCTSGESVFIAIAINFGLVTAVLIHVLVDNFRAFCDLETSKAALLAEQAQTRLLQIETERLAHTDSLTGLPNRRAFFAELDRLIADGRGSPAGFALGIVDLDGFKPINDKHGHMAGDRVLVEAGRRLQEHAAGRAMVARLGGDEFGILLTADAAGRAAAFGRALCARLSEPVEVAGVALACGSSCGLALFPEAARDPAQLYDRADYALYHAKGHERGAAVLFSPAHEECIREERAVEAALLGADLAAEMAMHFQPILDVETGRMVAAEALARWTSPVLGPVGPDRFIAVAERTGRIRVLTPVLFRKALAEAATWPAEIGLSFNLSTHDIGCPDTVLILTGAVRASGIDPRRVTFEITETAVMRDLERAEANIGLLRALGCRIGLDDFGVGYSSLSYVHRLSLDKIKIDRGFVQDVTRTNECRNVVRTVLDLCARLGLDCVVEGVETEEQCRLLAGLGGRLMQGYHFSRPLPAAELGPWLTRGGRVAEAA